MDITDVGGLIHRFTGMIVALVVVVVAKGNCVTIEDQVVNNRRWVYLKLSLPRHARGAGRDTTSVAEGDGE
jgi:hypothetical protein